MSHPRRSLVRSTLTKLRQLWKRREETRRDVRRCLGSTFEMLEPRYALTIGGALPSPTDHIHPILQIYLEGQQVVIPTDVGFNGSTHANPHTHDLTGTIHIGEGGPAGTGSTVRNVTLDDFFDVWASSTLTTTGARNANALFDTDLADGTSSPRIMDKIVNSSTHVLRMYVKETGDSAPELEYDSSSSSNNLARPELYVPRDADQVIISYDKIANVVDAPSFQPVANQTVLVGAPTMLGIDGFDPTGGPLTYSISVANPALSSATLQPTSNRSIVMNVTNFGQMTFQLFDNLTPRAAQHLAQIVNNGEYNNIKFYRIAHLGDGSDFVIQGGRNGVASSLGRFDDEFNTDLQFTAQGLLAMAKSTDDTNDAEIFVTGAPTRFLDMNHSIFGVLTDGDEVREAIQQSRTTGDGPPPSDIIVSSSQVVTDNQNTALLLKAAPGATGSTNVTMTVTDQQGKTFSQTFTVSFANDTANGAPFLNPISPVTGVSGQPITLQLTAQDVEGDPFFFDATKPSTETVNYTVSANNSTGLVTITPPAGFVGTFNVQVGVHGTTQTTTNDQFDTQLVSVTVGAGSPTLDLAAVSDSGSSNSDNITNASSLSFDLTGLTSGATVRILKGSTVIAQGVATSSTMTLTVADPGTSLGQGASELTVTQTVNGTTSPASSPLSVTYDTAVPTFSSTSPTMGQIGFNLNYNAQTNEEGGTGGLLYTLTNAPTGASINGSTGVVTWTPTSGQSPGPNNFSVVATDAAGNVATQALAVAVAAAQVDIKLELRDTSGVLLTSLSPGQDFVLRVLTQDVRTQPRGVFALYSDITYDSTKVSVTGPITYSNTYGSGRSGTTTTAGLIDEVGAFAGTSELGSGFFEVFTIPMRAATGATGTITFLSDPADVTPSHNVLVYGGSGTPGSGSPPVPHGEIHFGNASIQVGETFNAVNDTGTNFTVNEDTSNNTINPLANDANIGSNTNTLTISAVGTPSNGGTITRTQNNTRISYTPAANFQGTETFTYTARNQNGEEHIATVSMTVTNVNDPPVAVNDTLSASRNSTANQLNVLGNDTQGTDSGETLRVSAVGTGSAGGTITIGANGANVIYTPANNFSGTETFTYTITDRATGGLTATATATVNVSGLTANNDSGANFTVAEDSQNTTINPLANDALDTQVGGTLSITAVGTTSNGGTVSITENSTRLSYKPAANFQGTETFTYTITDGQGHNATATVSMTVTNVNDPPTAVNDTLTAFKNTTASLDVLANDTSTPDPTENLIIQAIATQPTNGTATITDAGKKISYTPNSGFTGSDSFTYTVRDPSGAESTATASITVQDFAPSNLSGFVYFDVNNNGIKDPGELAMSGVTITLTGTATAGGTTNVNLTAKTGEDGTYKFENIAPGTNYRITQTQPLFTIDGRETAGSQGGTATNNVITIANLAQATTGVNNNFGEMGRQITTISIRDFFSSTSRNYAHAAFDNAGVEVWHSTSGSVWQGATHAFTLQNSQSQIKLDSTTGFADGQSQVTTRTAATDLPVYLAGQSGSNRLYYVPGGTGGTNGGGTTNQAPTAINDVFGTPTGTALTVTAANGVLKNDTDPENNTLTASIVTQPTSGTVTLSSDGGFTYSPASGFTGSATFTYRVSDGNSQSTPATVTINVGPGTAPTAVADSFTATEDTPLTVTAANGVLRNDTDAENNTLTAAVVTQPTKGSVTLNNDGSFTYSPNANANGSDTFTYRASDGTNQSQPATVTITINALNDAPSFTIPAAPAAVNEDAAATTVNNFITNILAGGTDESGQTLTFNLTAGATTGGLTFSTAPTISPSGTLTYTPTANTSGTAVFNVTLSDNGSSTSPNSNTSTSQAFTITVNAVNDAPSFTLPSNTTTANEDAGATTVNAFATNISSGPTDESGQNRTFNLTLGTPTGTLAFSTAPAIDPTNGNLTFTPLANTNGSVVVTVTLSDNGSSTAPNVNTSPSQTFTINITATSDNPVGVADSYRVAPGATLTVNQADGVLKNDTDADGGTLTVASVTGVAAGTVGQAVATANGSVTLAANGSFTYTPNSGFIGSDTFTYTAFDGTNPSAATTVTITVNASPVAQNDTFSVNEGAVLSVTGNGVLQNDTDPNVSDTLTATDVTQPANGAVTLNANGTFTYTPNADFNGTDTFTYRANDGLATSNIATVTVTVNAVNDAPSFTLPATAPPVNEDAGAVEVATFVTAISAGPTNESSQTLTFLVTVTGATGNLAFTTAPTIDATGKLTYTPAANTNGTATVSVVLVDSGTDTPPNDNTSNTQTFSITVNAVNDAPARTSNAAAAITANEDSASTAVALGLSGLTYDTGGGSDEDTQTLSVKLTAIPSFITVFQDDGTTQVAVDQAISVAQLLTLKYKTVANASGTGNLTWSIQDNGGTALSGVDTLADSVSITINALNDAPSFTVPANATPVDEDDGAVEVADFVTNMSVGPADESSQTFTFAVNVTAGASLFSTPPAIDSTGKLTYTLADDANGTATITVVMNDSGSGTAPNVNASAAQTVTITVNAINDEPSFTIAADPPAVNEDAGAQTINDFVTDILAGPSNESSQTVTFGLTVGTPTGSLAFSVAPSIDADGDLTYTPQPNTSGTVTVTVVLTDSGSNTSPHDNTSTTETFVITVNPINDAPTFAIPDNSLVVAEDAPAQTEDDFVTNISAGPPDESSQTLLAFNVVLVAGSVTGDLAFNALPTIDTDGDLTYTVTPGTSGSATFTVTLVDSGLNTPPNQDTSAEATFTITVEPANPEPPEGEASDASAIDAALLEWLLTHYDGEFNNFEVGSDEWQAAVDEAMALLG